MEIAGESASSRGVAPRFSEARSFLWQRLEEGALFAALDVHIYHPLLLHSQTSGLVGHVWTMHIARLPPPQSNSYRRIEIRDTTRGLGQTSKLEERDIRRIVIYLTRNSGIRYVLDEEHAGRYRVTVGRKLLLR